ncbi:hypothetical protein HC928_16760 [bacterium]|nr:hypothetical protein [bacterium]
MINMLPPEWSQDLESHIHDLVQKSQRKLVVLDDDPTGTQTVYDIPVFTMWTVDVLAKALRDSSYVGFFILTNSRTMTAEGATKLNQEIAANLRAASRQTGVPVDVISRSDSTLRGHFPLEIDILYDALEGDFDGCLLIPFFAEGGRYTINDTHYVAEADRLTPAADTPFAQDRVFGYRSSNLAAWIEEKSGGRIQATEVASISIDDIRLGGPDRVVERLMALSGRTYCVVNAASLSDLHVVVVGLMRAQAQGKCFLFRTAASFVQARLGLTRRPLLDAEAIADPAVLGGGLILVGSYVPKTTAQLRHVVQYCAVEHIELDVIKLLNDPLAVVDEVTPRVNAALHTGDDIVVYTSRDLIAVDDAARNLAIGSTVSQSLISIVQAVAHRPRYILAKGGYHIQRHRYPRGLNVERALVSWDRFCQAFRSGGWARRVGFQIYDTLSSPGMWAKFIHLLM